MRCFKSQESGVRSQKLIAGIFLLFTAYCLPPTLISAQDNRPFLTDKDQFNYAMFLYKQGHYTVAAREFGRVIEYFPGSPVIPQAHYMIGDSHLNVSMYREAISQLQQFIKNFPHSEFKAEAAVKLKAAQTKLKETNLFSMPNLPVVKFPPQVLLHKEEEIIRAVQIALFAGKDYKEVDKEIGRLKAAGIDTIILRVFHNKGDRFYPFITISGKNQEMRGVYFKTKESPVIEDILGPVLDMAHKNGLKVFAWMTTRYADYGLEHRKDLGCKAYDFSTQDIVPCKGLDLFNEDVVAHLERLFNDLAAYPIDGILFQDDLVLKHHEGFGPYSHALFEKETGKRLVPDELYSSISENGNGHSIVQYAPEFWRWAAWKNKRLLEVATRVRTVVKKKNPEVKFAINLMYESVSNPPYAMAWLSQSLDEAVKHGFDYYAVMAYHQQMQNELNKGPYEVQSLIQKMTEDAVKRVGNPQKVILKFQIIDWNTSQPLPDKEVIGLLSMVKEVDNVSLAVVPYRKDFPFEELGGQKKVSQLMR